MAERDLSWIEVLKNPTENNKRTLFIKHRKTKHTNKRNKRVGKNKNRNDRR